MELRKLGETFGQGMMDSLFARDKTVRRLELVDRETALDAREEALRRREAALERRLCAGRVYKIAQDRIEKDPSSPHRVITDESLITLADSIRRVGILQPLCVRPLFDGGTDAPDKMRFTIIAGERRLRAARLIGLETVPCIVTEADNLSATAEEWIECLQRDGQDLFEQASVIASLCDVCRLSQEQIASKLCVSPSYVANKLRLLKLTEGERELIRGAGLCERHARALLRISDLGMRRDALCAMVRAKMNVAQAEEYVERRLGHDAQRSARRVPPEKTRIVLKDMGLFFNSVQKAVDVCREGGVDILSHREETEEEICWVLRIPKQETLTAAKCR